MAEGVVGQDRDQPGLMAEPGEGGGHIGLRPAEGRRQPGGLQQPLVVRGGQAQHQLAEGHDGGRLQCHGSGFPAAKAR